MQQCNREATGKDIENKRFCTNLKVPKELPNKVRFSTRQRDEWWCRDIQLWDLGCGDEVIKGKLKAIEDLVLLPNLKKVIGFENSKMSKQFVSELKKRGIEIESEET